MIIGLSLLTVVLTALVVSICMLLYSKQIETMNTLRVQQEMLANLDAALKDLSGDSEKIYKRVNQLSADVMQREIYQNAGDRHQLSIQSAKEGKGLFELMQIHGLSSDEAALILSLHSPQAKETHSNVKNANLIDPTAVDLI